MGEELNDFKIYFQLPDGRKLEFDRLETAQFIEPVESPCRLPDPSSMHFEMALTSKANRKIRKLFKKFKNRIMRKERTRKRMKEQARRAMLKWRKWHGESNNT